VALFRGHTLLDASTISAKKNKSFILRTLNIADAVVEYMDSMRGRISPRDIDVVIEIPGNQNRPGRQRSLIPIGCSTGVLTYAAYNLGYRIHLNPATLWTRMGTSRGIAKEKRTVIIRNRFPDYLLENDKGMDAADAIGVAAAWMNILPGMEDDQEPLG